MAEIKNDYIVECFNKSFMQDKGKNRVKLNAKQALEEILNPKRKMSDIPSETLRAYAKIFKPIIR